MRHPIGARMTSGSPRLTVQPSLGARFRPLPLTLEQRLCVYVVATLTALIAGIATAIYWICDGHLIYSLDDPYISLSLGWHIAHGEYGINAGEAASPSSSILYPLILSAFGWSGWQQYVPLGINAAAALGTGGVFAIAACRYQMVTRPSQLARGTALIVALCVSINTLGVVFVGLEHSLHALTGVVVILGLARTIEERRVPGLLVVAIVLLPLWRFEGCALAILAIVALASLGHLRHALLALLATGLSLAAYVEAMHILGLPPLPSSVLVKSEVASEVVGGIPGFSTLINLIADNLSHSLNREAVPVFLLIGLVAARPTLRVLGLITPNPGSWSLKQETLFAGVAAVGLIAHLLFGKWHALQRYAVYAVAFGAVAAIVLWHEPIAWLVDRGHPILVALAMAAVLDAGLLYVATTLATPLAARGTYEKQYQMHRFAADYYRRPVAVNDLGWVSYRNPNYVLDLWGLGSEAARRAGRGTDPNWIARMTAARQVGVAMIDADKFAVPPGWRRVAVLRAPHYIAREDETVTFFATSMPAVGPALAALHAFSRDLVRDTSLTIFDDAAGQAQAGSLHP